VRLTKTAIKALTLPEGVRDHTFFDDDLPGFGLRVRASGAKRWVVQYNVGRRCRRVVLGTPDSLDPGKAREMAKDIIAAVRLGRDPAGERHQARADHAQSLGCLVPRYLDYKRTSLRASTFTEVERALMVHARRLHGLAIKAIDRRAIAELIGEVVITSGPAAADKARASLHAFFLWAIRDGLTEVNPVTAINRPVTNGPRTRLLAADELRLIWNTLGDDTYGDIVKLLLLTAARREEIGALRWVEVDLDDPLINLPPERMKAGRQHIIALAPQALTILKKRHAQADGHPYVFAGLNFRGEPRSFGDWSNARRRHHARIAEGNYGKLLPDWRLHDFRRAASTVMHDKLGIAPHVVEACLAHHTGSTVSRTYNLACYLEQRRAALTAWAEYIEGIVTDGEVIALRSAA
jgi:integrase